MSAEVLRRAAEGIRANVAAAPVETRTSGLTSGVWLHSAFHMTTTPAKELAVADWLESEVVRAEFRERQQREINSGLREGLAPYPCYYDGQTERAIAVARAYLREAS